MFVFIVIALILETFYILYISLKRVKYQGRMLVNKEEDGKLTYLLEIDENPDGFQHMNDIRFKVVKENTQDIHSI